MDTFHKDNFKGLCKKSKKEQHIIFGKLTKQISNIDYDIHNFLNNTTGHNIEEILIWLIRTLSDEATRNTNTIKSFLLDSFKQHASDEYVNNEPKHHTSPDMVTANIRVATLQQTSHDIISINETPIMQLHDHQINKHASKNRSNAVKRDNYSKQNLLDPTDQDQSLDNNNHFTHDFIQMDIDETYNIKTVDDVTDVNYD